MTREDVLNKAKFNVCGDRDVQYGKPEDSFAAIAELWTAYLETKVSAEDVCIMMALFKIGRMKTGYAKMDNYVDCAGYIACAGELS